MCQSKFLIFVESKAGPSTRPIKPLPKAPMWKGGPQNFEKEGIVGKKNLVIDETPKNLIHPCDQRTKNLEHSCKHWYPKKFLGLNIIINL